MNELRLHPNDNDINYERYQQSTPSFLNGINYYYYSAIFGQILVFFFFFFGSNFGRMSQL